MVVTTAKVDHEQDCRDKKDAEQERETLREIRRRQAERIEQAAIEEMRREKRRICDEEDRKVSREGSADALRKAVAEQNARSESRRALFYPVGTC